MRAITIYDQDTGEIKKTLIVPSTHRVQLSEGEALLEGQYDDDKYFIKEGEPYAKPVAEDEATSWGAGSKELAVDDRLPTLNDVRFARNQMLAASDWTQLPDAPVDQAAWAEYRQALRDLPDNTSDPSNPVWPELPQ